jgi:hypothetical protein
MFFMAYGVFGPVGLGVLITEAGGENGVQNGDT